MRNWLNEILSWMFELLKNYLRACIAALIRSPS